MVNNKIEGKSTGGKATKPIQETLMLSWSSPLPSNHSPSACRGFWGTLSTLHGQADPSWALPTHGAGCACRHAVQLCSSLGPAEQGNLGLVLAQVSLEGLSISRRGPVPILQFCSTPRCLRHLEPSLETQLPGHPSLCWSPGSPNPALPGLAAAQCCRAGSWPMGCFLDATYEGELTGVGGNSAAPHMCRGSLPITAHSLRGNGVGLFGVCGVFSLPLLTQPRETKKPSFLWQHLCSPVSSCSPSLLGLGTHAWGVPTRHGQSCPWEFRSELWPRS